MEGAVIIASVDEDKNESDPGNQQVNAHVEKEAELEAYLDSLKPKPKRKSIKEMLMSLPSFKDLATIKPKIGGGDAEKEEVIILDEETCTRQKAKNLKRQQQIELLKERFVRHCIVPSTKSVKGEHVKLKINKKEEDSQGIEHLVENEVEYVRNPLNEEDDAVNFLSTPQSVSPQAAPGVNRRRIQENLLGQIHARKLKEHEQRVKDFEMYNDENDEGDKEEDEEVVEDEELSENDEDAEEEEEEEEELEDLLNNATKKKKKSKSAYIDDEAEDEDDDDGDDSADEDSDSTDDEDEKQTDTEAQAHDLKNKDDITSVGCSEEDSISAANVPCEKYKEMCTPVKNPNNYDPQKDMDADFTPKVTTAVLNQRTPSDFWIPAKSNLSCRPVDDISPLIPRLSKPEIQKEKHINPEAPESLANVISEPKAKFDDLVELCSGRFVSQVNKSSVASQDEDEFCGFDFGDDEDEMRKEKDNDVKTEESIKTPKTDSAITAVDGITPKICEKVPKTRLLMQFDEEAERSAENEASNKEDNPIDSKNNLEDDEVIVGRTRKRKQKRLQFSDDEDEGNDDIPPSNTPSEDEQSVELESGDEAESISQEISPAKPTTNKFFNKYGLLKRKFVEDEAELSGSEEGSDDEDEKDLNDYEMEEADNEELDVDAVKNQVERAHLKRLLDDDDREIRYLQNTYLENGDLHSDRQREKKFKWGFNANELNDDAHLGDSDNEETEENPEETSQKLAWIEKRKWLSENSHLLDSGEEHSLFSNSQFLRIGKNTIRKIESFMDTSTSESKDLTLKETSMPPRRSIYEEIISAKCVVNKKETNEIGLTACSEGMNFQLDSKDASDSNKSMSQPLFGELTWTKKSTAALKKGSFLSRGGMLLSKLAEGSKPGDAVSNVKNNSRNFVFQHITPPNPEKTDGSTSRVKRVVAKAGKQPAKKPKVDRSFSNLDEASKGASVFKWL